MVIRDYCPNDEMSLALSGGPGQAQAEVVDISGPGPSTCRPKTPDVPASHGHGARVCGMPYPEVGVVQVGAQPVIGEAWARVNSHVTSSDVGKARHVVETQASPSMWQSGRLLPYKTLRFSRAPIFRLRNRGLCPRTGYDVCGVLGNPAASCADTT